MRHCPARNGNRLEVEWDAHRVVNDAGAGSKKTGSTPLERVVLRVSLLSLVAGLVVAVTGHYWQDLTQRGAGRILLPRNRFHR